MAGAGSEGEGSRVLLDVRKLENNGRELGPYL